MEDSTPEILCPVTGGDNDTATTSTCKMVSFHQRHDRPSYELFNDISILQSVVLDKMMKLTKVFSCRRILSVVSRSGDLTKLRDNQLSDFYVFDVEVSGSLLESVNWEKRSIREKYLEKLKFFKEKLRGVDSKLAVLLEERKTKEQKQKKEDNNLLIFMLEESDHDFRRIDKAIAKIRGFKDRIEAEIERISGYLKSGSFTRKLRILMYKDKNSVLLEENCVFDWFWRDKTFDFRKYCAVRKLDEAEKTRRVWMFYKAMKRTDITRFLGPSRKISPRFPSTRVLYEAFGNFVTSKQLEFDDLRKLSRRKICVFESKMVFYRGNLVVDNNFCSITVPSRFKLFRTIHLTPAFFVRHLGLGDTGVDVLMKFLLSVKRDTSWLPVKSSSFPSLFLDRLIFLLLCFSKTTNEFSLLSNDVVLYSILPWLPVMELVWMDVPERFKYVERLYTLSSECKDGQLLEMAQCEDGLCAHFQKYFQEQKPLPHRINSSFDATSWYCECMGFFALVVTKDDLLQVLFPDDNEKEMALQLLLRRFFESFGPYFDDDDRLVIGDNEEERWTAVRVFDQGFQCISRFIMPHRDVLADFVLNSENDDILQTFARRVNSPTFGSFIKNVWDKHNDKRITSMITLCVQTFFVALVVGGKYELWPEIPKNVLFTRGSPLYPRERESITTMLKLMVHKVYEPKFFSFNQQNFRLEDSPDASKSRNYLIAKLVLRHLFRTVDNRGFFHANESGTLIRSGEYIEALDVVFGLVNSIFHWEINTNAKGKIKNGKKQELCHESCTEIIFGIVFKLEQSLQRSILVLWAAESISFSLFNSATVQQCSFRSKQFWLWVKKWFFSLSSIPKFHNVYTTFWDDKTDAGKFLQQFGFGIGHFEAYRLLVTKFLKFISNEILEFELFGTSYSVGERRGKIVNALENDDWQFIFTFMGSILLNISEINAEVAANDDNGMRTILAADEFENQIIQVFFRLALVFFVKFSKLFENKNGLSTPSDYESKLELCHLFLDFFSQHLSFCLCSSLLLPVKENNQYPFYHPRTVVLSDVISHSICCVYQSIPLKSLMLEKRGRVSGLAKKIVEFLGNAQDNVLFRCGMIEFSTQEFLMRKGDNKFLRELTCTLSKSSIRLCDQDDVKKLYLLLSISRHRAIIPVVEEMIGVDGTYDDDDKLSIFEVVKETSCVLRLWHPGSSGLEFVFQFFLFFVKGILFHCTHQGKTDMDTFFSFLKRIFLEKLEIAALERLLKDSRCMCTHCGIYRKRSSFQTLFFHKVIRETRRRSHTRFFINGGLSRWIISLREQFMNHLLDLVLERKDFSILSSIIAPDRYLIFIRHHLSKVGISSNTFLPLSTRKEYLHRITKFLALFAKVNENPGVEWDRISVALTILICFKEIRSGFDEGDSLFFRLNCSESMSCCILSHGRFVLEVLMESTEEELKKKNCFQMQWIHLLCEESISEVVFNFCVSTLPDYFYMFGRQRIIGKKRIYHPNLPIKALLIRETCCLRDFCSYLQSLLTIVQKRIIPCHDNSLINEKLMKSFFNECPIYRLSICLVRLVWSSFDNCHVEKTFLDTVHNLLSFFHSFYSKNHTLGGDWIKFLNTCVLTVLSRAPLSNEHFDGLTEQGKINCETVVKTLCDFLEGVEFKRICSELLFVLLSSRWTVTLPLTKRLLEEKVENMEEKQISGIIELAGMINGKAPKRDQQWLVLNNEVDSDSPEHRMPTDWEFGDITSLCSEGNFGERVFFELMLSKYHEKTGKRHPLDETKMVYDIFKKGSHNQKTEDVGDEMPKPVESDFLSNFDLGIPLDFGRPVSQSSSAPEVESFSFVPLNAKSEENNPGGEQKPFDFSFEAINGSKVMELNGEPVEFGGEITTVEGTGGDIEWEKWKDGLNDETQLQSFVDTNNQSPLQNQDHGDPMTSEEEILEIDLDAFVGLEVGTLFSKSAKKDVDEEDEHEEQN